MITPRITRLVRVPDLQSMHAAIARRTAGAVLDVRRCAVLVPTHAAASELRRTLEDRRLATSGVLALPDLLTREDLYEQLHANARLPRRLSPQDREVLLRRAARTAATEIEPPFNLRPGLLLEMLRFYDELRRREQSLDDFSRLATSQLEPSAPVDRGAERLLRQTEYLCATYLEFERLTHDSGGLDEHGMRTLLVDAACPQRAYTHVVVTLGDRTADPFGLYGSDFVLLSRLPGIQRLDVVATEALLSSGFHERIHALLPDLVEERFTAAAQPPSLIAPESGDDDTRWFTFRDREEELVEYVNELRHRSGSQHDLVRPGPLDRCAVVFQRPLPYLYLARQVFADADVPYQTIDALPLSAEPFPAALDVVLSFLSAEANRDSTIALLSSPHLTLAVDGSAVDALDHFFREKKFAGGWDRLASIEGTGSAALALDVARVAAAELSNASLAGSASAQFDALLRFLKQHERMPAPDATWRERHLRARAAVFATIESLRDAHAAHDDEPLELAELAGTIRRWIDAQTFSPSSGRTGVRLLDATAAAYADVDELRIVGLVEGDWPEPSARSIFYPSSILSHLGWPAESAWISGRRARFHDLLNLPRRRLSASAFTLESDSLVSPSAFGEELDAPHLAVERTPPPISDRGNLRHLAASAPEWFALRAARTAGTADKYRGLVGDRQTPTYAVSYVERYVDCPFKYFAAQVLRLREERDEEPGLSAQERGQFIHDVFEQFFRDWQAAGNGTITTRNVADAIELFEHVVDSKLERLPEADRPLERTHLLGSAAASGLAERAFAFEIEQGGDVTERLLEHEIKGAFVFAGADGPREVAIRAKADRIDLMADGTFRVIDYKLSRAPKLARALQLPIYGVCASQSLDGHRGRSWTLGGAGYVAFKEKDPFVPLAKPAQLASALADGQRRFLEAIDGIERGEYPVRPEDPFRCQWCGYSSVCRKDYVGDD